MPLFPVGTEIPDYYAKPQWFIGRTKYCHEHKAAGMLDQMGVEYFLAQQTVRRKLSDRIKKAQVLLLPRYIFIRCMNSQRVEILERCPSITHFMADHETHLAAVIRADQLERFRLMIDYEDQTVTIDGSRFVPGDRVRVKCGPLMGHECDLVEIQNSYYASRILSYRRKLGGYTSNSQILEIDGIPDSVVRWFVITDTARAVRISVNSATLSQLRSHPYINFYQARAIIEMRRERGNIKGPDQLSFMEEFTDQDLVRLEPYLDYR